MSAKKTKSELLKEKQGKAKELRAEISELREATRETREAIKALNAKKKEFRALERKSLEILKGEVKPSAKHNEKFAEVGQEYVDLLLEHLPTPAPAKPKK